MGPGFRNLYPNGNVLISGTDKIIEVTPDKQIVWSYSLGIDNYYAAVPVVNGDPIISDNYALCILTVSPSGTLVSSVGFPGHFLYSASFAYRLFFFHY